MLKKIRIKNFRKFETFELETNYNFLILSGENATGKTTILEAIYLLSTAKSPRTNELTSLIQYDKDFAIAEAWDEEKKYKIVLSQNGKAAFINDVEYKKMSDYIAQILMVMFSPKDLNLIIGTRGDRRRFFDLMISMCDKKYLILLNQYKTILKERNEILKKYDEHHAVILSVMTDRLVEISQKVMTRRNKFIVLLNQEIKKVTDFMVLEAMTVLYKPSLEGDIKQQIAGKQKYDILTKTTNIGPHRDDYGFLLDDKKANQFASQGQLRSIIIALKLALKETIEICTKRDVVLLLDDVFGELDAKRQENLVRYLLKQKQTFITTTSVHEIPQEILKHAFVFDIKKGS